MSHARHLVVIGSNPPTTSGARTLRRVEVARELLGFQTVEVINISPVPTYRTTNLSDVGEARDGWDQARSEILEAVERASAVMLAYGVGHPTGAARHHHRSQVTWLDDLLATMGIPVWWVGGQPRHPSRWHRYTHRMDPARDFLDVLPEALSRRS